MNNITLIGRLINNPELNFIGESNNAVTSFTIAVSRNYKNKIGIVESDFIRIEFWGKRAEICAQYIQKGKLVAIEGSIRTDRYETSEGSYKYKTWVLGNEIKFLDHNKSSDKKYYESPQIFNESNESTSTNISDEELTF
ncbi:Single-stranded DNA-binding protein ssbB [uncultured Clostridium sp.]|nr:Single-stranded DNA-binding protein ssbB [uncultured Clostridium sp.]